MSELLLERRIDLVEDRLKRMEGRLRRVESNLFIESSPLEPALPTVEADIAPDEPTEAMTDHLLAGRRRLTPPPLPTLALADADETQLKIENCQFPIVNRSNAEQTPTPVLPVADYHAPLPVVPRAEHQTAWEQTIGLKWVGWVGAVVLVIGASLGVKFAYDRGWFGGIPPAVSLSLIALAGFALIGAGEWVWRRIHKIPAASLFGAGVATLFIAAYAGNAYYKLYDLKTAFILMGVATLVGAGVAIRGNLVSIAVLSMIGGNIAPLALHTDHPQLVPFLSYLLMLQIVSLFLAWRGSTPKWWTLRGLSLATTTLWGGAILQMDDFVPRWMTETVFVIVFAALYHGELIASAFASRRAAVARAQWDRVSQAIGAAGFSLLITAALTAGLFTIFADSTPTIRVICCLILAASATLAAIVFSRSESESAAIDALAITYSVQAAALIALAVPVGLSGINVVFGWAVLALAFAFTGALTGAKVGVVAGPIVWGLAVLDLLRWSVDPSTASDAQHPWVDLSFLQIPAACVIAWMLTVAGQIIAWVTRGTDILPLLESTNHGRDAARLSSSKSRATASVIISIVAGIVWIAASIAGLTPGQATVAIVIYVWLLAGADVLSLRMKFAIQAAAALAIATVKWIAVDTLAGRLGNTPIVHAPILNSMTACGVLLAGSIVALNALRRESLRSAERFPASLIAAAGGLILWAGTVEIDHSVGILGSGIWPGWQLRGILWTIWWTLGITAFFAASTKVESISRTARGLRRPAAVLLILLGAKFIVIDWLFWRLMEGCVLAPVLMNPAAGAGAVVIAGLLLVRLLSRDGEVAGEIGEKLRRAIGLSAIFVILATGTMEIDRAFEILSARGGVFADPRLAKQVAFSIFWSISAVALVVLGFSSRAASLRYIGLSLLAITLLKIVIVDLSQVGSGYRILSFVGLGLLMLGTSVVYGKLSPKLLGEEVGSR